MNELKDIKEIVEVQEYSLWWLLGTVGLVLSLFMFGLYLFTKRRKRRRKPSEKELALSTLRRLDYSNTKEVVYTFEDKASKFLNEKNQAKFENIVKELGVYKYKKEIPSLEKKVEDAIRAFIKELR